MSTKTDLQLEPRRLSGPSNSPQLREGAGFLDLPPELRNIIYLQVLCCRFPIYWDWETLAQRTGSGRRNHSKAHLLLNLTPQVLAVCKQIYREAVPILYGNNVHTIITDAIPGYLSLCGRNKEFLRHIDIGQGICHIRDHELRALSRLPNLRVLSVATVLLEGDKRGHLIRNLLMVMEQIYETRKMANESTNVWDMVQLNSACCVQHQPKFEEFKKGVLGELETALKNISSTAKPELDKVGGKVKGPGGHKKGSKTKGKKHKGRVQATSKEQNDGIEKASQALAGLRL